MFSSLFFFSFFLFFLLSSASGGSATLASPSYIIMVDAGSSGSRLHVHKFYFEAGQPLPVIEASNNKKITPGLSSFAEEPSGAAAHVDSLIRYAYEQIPEEERSSTPIHLQATAGLRSISPEAAEEILAVVRVVLSSSGFLFSPSWALTISGEQEGLNGWLASNYLLGSFSESSDIQTHGVVEMGGSSMQITFVPLAPSSSSLSRLYSISIAGRSYDVYTHSFLQYGLQAAERLFQEIAIEDIENSGNPCYPRGLKHSATGNFQACAKLMKGIVDRSKACDYESCSFNGIFQPTIAVEPFLAIENFFYTAQFFGHVDAAAGDLQGAVKKGTQLMKALKEAGEEFCDLEWKEIVDKHGKSVESSKLGYFCFAAAYESAVLEEGFGFKESSNLKPAKTIKNRAIEWEIGAALLQIINSHNYRDIVEQHGPVFHHSKSTPSALRPAEKPLAIAAPPFSSTLAQSNAVYFYFFGLLFSTLCCAWIYQRLRKPGHAAVQHWAAQQNSGAGVAGANWNKV